MHAIKSCFSNECPKLAAYAYKVVCSIRIKEMNWDTKPSDEAFPFYNSNLILIINRMIGMNEVCFPLFLYVPIPFIGLIR